MIAWKALALSFVMVAAGTTSSMALTNSNSVPATTVGYGTSTISGATATSIVYTLNGSGTQITGAALTFTGDITTGKVVKAGFGGDALTTCTIGSYADPSTAVACAGFTQASSTASAFNVAVTNS
jgi:hypothetical protein